MGRGGEGLMAQDRFYFWRGYYDALATLPTDEQRGRFVMAVCQYAFEGEVPDLSDDPVLAFAWMVVRDQVAESVDIGRKQAERGRKGGRPKSGAKSGAKSGVKSGAESGAESVRYGNVPSGYAPSLTAPALAADERPPATTMAGGDPRWEGVEPSDPETARRQAMAVLEMMDAEQSGDGDR